MCYTNNPATHPKDPQWDYGLDLVVARPYVQMLFHAPRCTHLDCSASLTNSGTVISEFACAIREIHWWNNLDSGSRQTSVFEHIMLHNLI